MLNHMASLQDPIWFQLEEKHIQEGGSRLSSFSRLTDVFISVLEKNREALQEDQNNMFTFAKGKLICMPMSKRIYHEINGNLFGGLMEICPFAHPESKEPTTLLSFYLSNGLFVYLPAESHSLHPNCARYSSYITMEQPQGIPGFRRLTDSDYTIILEPLSRFACSWMDVQVTTEECTHRIDYNEIYRMTQYTIMCQRLRAAVRFCFSPGQPIPFDHGF
ncbi:hypothetical protein PROFUN_00681 [Planoprotostelium fungivorum]|uniref:Uncharacterized protein n=1 Tax=Planoprotostelium fungivorum TaxID=1890364 RepID=A0A2P6NU67_9EUKA|nr:hypothetical protein PROFUN_00681 [Planoprotostelium fungivorum]